MDHQLHHASSQSPTDWRQDAPRISLVDMTMEVTVPCVVGHKSKWLPRLTNELLWKTLHLVPLHGAHSDRWHNTFAHCLPTKGLRQGEFNFVTLELMCLKYVSFVYNGPCEDAFGDAAVTRSELGSKATEMVQGLTIFTPPVPPSATPPSGLLGPPLPSGTHTLKDILRATIRATWHLEGHELEDGVFDACETLFKGVNDDKRLSWRISPETCFPLPDDDRLEHEPWKKLAVASLADILYRYSLFYHDAKDEQARSHAERIMLDSISFPDPKPVKTTTARDFLVCGEEEERIYLHSMIEQVVRANQKPEYEGSYSEMETVKKIMALVAEVGSAEASQKPRSSISKFFDEGLDCPSSLDDLAGAYLTNRFGETLTQKNLDLAKQAMLQSLTLAKPPASPDALFLRMPWPGDWPVKFGLEEMVRAVVGTQGLKSRKDEEAAVRWYLDSVLYGKMLGLSPHRHADAALRTVGDVLAMDETAMLHLAEKGRTLKSYMDRALHGKLPNKALEGSGDDRAAPHYAGIGDVIRRYKTDVLRFEEKPLEPRTFMQWWNADGVDLSVDRAMRESISFAKPIVAPADGTADVAAGGLRLTDGRAINFPGRHRAEIVPGCQGDFGVPNYDFSAEDWEENTRLLLEEAYASRVLGRGRTD